MSDKKRTVSYTAYDKAVRILETECDDALLQFVNYVFHEDYDNTAKIIRLRNQHFVEHTDGETEEQITDSHFSITFRGKTKKYHMECQSNGYSGSMLIRIIQYAFQTAIDDSTCEYDEIKIKIPQSVLFVLRNKGNPPEKARFRIITPGGEVSYEAPVICEAWFSIDEMFENKLHFLLPFFAFNLESQMDIYERDKEKLKEFEDIYFEVIERIHQLPEAVLSLRTKGVIIKEMAKVIRRLNEKRENVIRKVGDIMMDSTLEWLREYDAAVAKGKVEGKEEKLISQICRKLRKGKSVTQIADELEESEIRVRVICDTAAEFAPDYDEEKVIKAVLNPVED
ncbi:hypothetical protein [Oribacterium sp. FC2011]|uniref:hypothetical protein n=1 Tax=Oribacterium sp. FC2011 TaxID=1408311 RepID=UPI0006798DD0|nr:hypothetical protein [Oribacterium sp. FC2011]